MNPLTKAVRGARRKLTTTFGQPPNQPTTAKTTGQSEPIVVQVRADALTYLPEKALQDLFDLAAEAESSRRAGVFIEAGCALGGSALVITKAKRSEREFFVHDVFGQIPPPTEQDGADVHERYERINAGKAQGIGGNTYYGYEDHLMDKVAATFAGYGLALAENSVTLVQGLFQNTITGDAPVALAHVDGDWYESVKTCLDRIGPRLTTNGVMVIDDYFKWSGCRTAVDEFLTAHPDTYASERRTRLIIRKL